MNIDKELFEEAMRLLTTDTNTEEARILLYEAIGCTRGDAQGIVEAEDMRK
jgi:hypothetical protein